MIRRDVLQAALAAPALVIPSVAFGKEHNMGLSRFGFLVTGAGLDPRKDRVVMQSDSFTMIVIGMAQASDGPAAAKQLADEGVQLIELCGGFGPLWTARVLEATGGRIPVGSVAYGPESINGMHTLFPN